LFLDEPTTGFDPSARRQAWEVIAELTKLGKTVLLTTHYMEEAQVLADRVIVMAAGVIVAEGTPESIGGRADAVTTIEFVLPSGATVGELPVPVEDDGHGVVGLATAEPTRVLHLLTSWAVERSIELEGLSITRPTLEDVYLALTSHDDRESP